MYIDLLTVNASIKSKTSQVYCLIKRKQFYPNNNVAVKEKISLNHFTIINYICNMIQANYILFISAPEILVVVFVILIFFGADKVPEIVRGLAKAIKEVKNATNDIKSEITKTVEEQVDLDFTKEFSDNITKDITKEIDEVKDSVEDITGPIKRRR